MEEEKKRDIRWKSFWLGAGCAALICALTAAGAFCLWFGGSQTGPFSFQAAKKMRAIRELIDQRYDGEVDEEWMEESMYRGLIAGLGDPYSTYYTQEEFETVESSQQGYYQGIGVTVMLGDDCIVVTEVHADTPAMEAGLLPDDRIMSIDGEETAGKTLSEAVALIKEGPQETVRLLIDRDGESEPFEVELQKERVKMETVKGELLEEGIGCLTITEFNSLTPDQFREARAALEEQGMSKLIVDLRDNPGGLLTSVCDTLRQILPEGLIVYMEDKYGNREEYTCDGEEVIDMPLAVLVNGNSASAAEIFTGAVKDYELGTIVGTRTFGKGIVQNTFSLWDGSVVKLTIAHYYTPKGSDIHGVGIEPDLEVEASEEEGEDAQLEAALELLR